MSILDKTKAVLWAEPTIHSAGCSTFDAQRDCFPACTFAPWLHRYCCRCPSVLCVWCRPKGRGHARLPQLRRCPLARISMHLRRCQSACGVIFQAHVLQTSFLKNISIKSYHSSSLSLQSLQFLTAAEAEETQSLQKSNYSSRRQVRICLRCSTRPFLSAN